MTKRESFIVRTSRRLVEGVFRNAMNDLGETADENSLRTVIGPLAVRAADDFLSETQVQNEIRNWNRTRLVYAVARDIEDRVRVAVDSYKHGYIRAA